MPTDVDPAAWERSSGISNIESMAPLEPDAEVAAGLGFGVSVGLKAGGLGIPV